MASTLTPQQAAVAAMIGRGMSNREIADHFVISERTVETHARNIRQKLGLRSRADMQQYDEILDQLTW